MKKATQVFLCVKEMTFEKPLGNLRLEFVAWEPTVIKELELLVPSPDLQG